MAERNAVATKEPILDSKTTSSGSSVTLPVPTETSDQSNDLENMTTEKSQDVVEAPSKVTTAQDWTGFDDPENAENWPASKKAYHVSYVGMQSFVTTFGSSVYAPAISQVAEQFSISPTQATLPLTLYVLGLAFGPVISAPISETYGRSIVYLTLFPISLLFTLGSGLAQNYATLMVCRFLAGALGSGCLAIGAGTISDLYSPLKRAPVSAVFLIAPFFGPALGPVAGSFLVQYKTWRWTQWLILMVGLITVVMGFFQKETYKKIILTRRAKRLGLPPPPNPMAAMSPAQRAKFVLTVTITRPVVMLCTEPIVTFLAIYTAFNFGVLFAFFAAFPVVFESLYPEVQVYHFNQGESGLVFVGIGIGVLLGGLIFIVGDRLYYQPLAKKEIANGKDERSLLLAPEYRVLSAVIGSFILPIGLFWFAWTARADIHWIVPIIATIFFGTGNLLVFFTAVMYQLDTYGPMMGASAMAANGILRYVFGAVFPLFARQMYRVLGVGWATSLLGFITVGLMPVPWVLFKYGRKIRSKSKYATFSKDV